MCVYFNLVVPPLFFRVYPLKRANIVIIIQVISSMTFNINSQILTVFSEKIIIALTVIKILKMLNNFIGYP